MKSKNVLKGTLIFLLTTVPVVVLADPSKLLKREWYEARSTNFHVISNTSEKEAVEVVANLELFRHAVAVFIKIRNQDEIPTVIYALDDLHVLQGAVNETDIKQFDGFFVQTPDGNVAIANLKQFSGNSSAYNWARQVVFHEYVHSLMRESEWKGFFPLWFSEGVASYLATFRTHREGYEFGVLDLNKAARLKQDPYVPVEELMKARSYPQDVIKLREFYSDAFKTTFFIYTTPGMMKKTMQYIAYLNRGAQEDQAFRSAFGADYEDLAITIRDHFARKKRLDKLRLPYGAYKQPQITVTALGEAAVYRHAARLLGLPFVKSDDQTIETLLKESIARDPGDLSGRIQLLYRYLAQKRLPEAEAQLEKSAAVAAADDARTLTARAALLIEQAKMKKFFDADGWPGLMRRALDDLAAAVGKDPHYSRAYTLILDAYLQKLATPDAAQRAQIADAMQKLLNNQITLRMVGDLHEQYGDHEKALDVYVRYCNLSAHEGTRCDRRSTLDLLGWRTYQTQTPAAGSGNVYRYSDGSTYVGDFKDGKPNGHGVAQHANGSRYEGDWKDGLFHGKGKFSWSFGQWYAGDFSRGQTQGKGEINYPSGARYVGDFAEQFSFHGNGVYYWPNGATYNGEFRDDAKHGEGALTFKGGKTFRTEWRKGLLKMNLENGEVFYGDYAYDAAGGRLKPRGAGYCIRKQEREPAACKY